MCDVSKGHDPHVSSTSDMLNIYFAISKYKETSSQWTDQKHTRVLTVYTGWFQSSLINIMFLFYKVEFTQACDTVSVSLSGMRSVSWMTGGSSYEPSRSATSTRIPVCRTTGWLRPSCTATLLHGCLSRCVSQCVTAPACDRLPPPAERRSPCSTNKPTPRESWRGPG